MTPQKHHIVIMGTPCKLLQEWLMECNQTWRVSPKAGYAVDVDRNQTINHFLLHEPNYTHLIMLDHDMVPSPWCDSLGALLMHQEHPLITCGYVGTAGAKGHCGDGEVGASALRVSRELLEQMGAPWFKTIYNDELTMKLDCECNHFKKRALDIGVESKMIGHIGHQQGGNGGVILYPSTHKRGFEPAFPCDLEIAYRNMCQPLDLKRNQSNSINDGTRTASTGIE